MAFYTPKAQRERLRKKAQGVGKPRERGSFWAGMLMGAATATGGFFAIKALEKAFTKKDEGVLANPGVGSASARLMVAATTGSPNAPVVAALNPKPPVVKRTVIEEMVEDLDE